MALFRTHTYGHKNKPVVFLIGGWTYRPALLWPFALYLARKGFYCVTYTYDNSVFSPDYQKTTADLTTIKNSIVAHIAQLKADGHHTFAIFGTSLGSALASTVANESADVSKIILNTTGGDIAESVWTWDIIKPWFKNDLLGQRVTLAKLKDYWRPISPIYHTNRTVGKKALIYLARKDKLIPYAQGKALAKQLAADGCQCELIINKYLNHQIAGLYNLMRARRYVRFLRG